MKQRYLLLVLFLIIIGLTITHLRNKSKVITLLTFQPQDSTLMISVKNSGRQKAYLPLDDNFILNSKVFFIDRDGLLTSWAGNLSLTLLDFYEEYLDYKYIEEAGMTLINGTILLDTQVIESKILDSIYFVELTKSFIQGDPVRVYEKHFLSRSDTLYKYLSPSDKIRQASIYQRNFELMKNKERYYLSPGDELVNKICIKNWLESISQQNRFQDYSRLAIVFDEKISSDNYGFDLQFPATVLDYKLFSGKLKSDTLYISLIK